MSPVRSCWKLPLCLTEPMPAVSKTDLLMAKAEAVSNGCSASMITYIRMGKKNNCAMATTGGERSENLGEN